MRAGKGSVRAVKGSVGASTGAVCCSRRPRGLIRREFVEDQGSVGAEASGAAARKTAMIISGTGRVEVFLFFEVLWGFSFTPSARS